MMALLIPVRDKWGGQWSSPSLALHVLKAMDRYKSTTEGSTTTAQCIAHVLQQKRMRHLNLLYSPTLHLSGRPGSLPDLAFGTTLITNQSSVFSLGDHLKVSFHFPVNFKLGCSFCNRIGPCRNQPCMFLRMSESRAMSRRTSWPYWEANCRQERPIGFPSRAAMLTCSPFHLLSAKLQIKLPLTRLNPFVLFKHRHTFTTNCVRPPGNEGSLHLVFLKGHKKHWVTTSHFKTTRSCSHWAKPRHDSFGHFICLL